MSRQKDTRYCNSYATNFRYRTLVEDVWVLEGATVTGYASLAQRKPMLPVELSGVFELRAATR